MPPTPDSLFTGLDEFVIKPVVENRKSDEEVSEIVRKNNDAPIIEEWVSDSDKENVSRPKTEKKTVKPIIAKIEFVKPKQQEKTTRKTVKQAEKHRQNTHILRGNQRNWNNICLKDLEGNPQMDLQDKGVIDSGCSSSHDVGSKPSSDDGKKVDAEPRKDSKSNDQEKEDNVNSTNNVNAASTNEVNVVGGKTSIELLGDPNMTALEDYNIFDFTRNDKDDGVEDDMNNLDTTLQVSPNLTTRINKDHPLDQVIGDLQSAKQTRNMSNNLKEHG
ncbi:hypothetical protein Tco_0178344, partial [Tanacetum coccineum]